MPKRPTIVDLFCGAGGASMGLHRAGWHVTGVDIQPQPRYPLPAFIQADALDVDLSAYDAVWASPPCQRWSPATGKQERADAPDLVAVVRDRLTALGVPWVIENVRRAHLRWPVLLRGDMFGLGVIRVRAFESSHILLAPSTTESAPRLGDRYVCVAGNGQNRSSGTQPYAYTKAAWSAAMGIDWMLKRELAQALPPAYSACLGAQLLHAARFPHIDAREFPAETGR